jgi:hypothetical protein
VKGVARRIDIGRNAQILGASAGLPDRRRWLRSKFPTPRAGMALASIFHQAR